MEGFTPYWPVVVLVVNLLIGWGVWSMRAAMKVELAAFDARLRLAEQTIQGLPRHHDITDLKSDMAGLVQQIAGVRDLVVRNEETTKTIHRYLMEKDR